MDKTKLRPIQISVSINCRLFIRQKARNARPLIASFFHATDAKKYATNATDVADTTAIT